MNVATWHAQLAVCKWLVETAGAELHLSNTYGCNAIQWVCQSPTEYPQAALAVCRWLRGAGLDVGVRNRNGHSAVHKAAMHGHGSVCKWLLSAEGGLTAAVHMQPDRDGSTPARLAKAHAHHELAAWLEAEELLV